MENIYDPVREVKSFIRRTVSNSQDLFELINNKALSSPDDMMYQNVFPYLTDPNTIQEVTNNIYFDVSETEGRKSKGKYWNGLVIDFFIVCDMALDNIKMPSGDSRMDLISNRLKELFLGKTGCWIGEITPVWDKPYTMTKGFLARSLRFSFEDVSGC